MNTILLLNDEGKRPISLLQDTARDKMSARVFEVGPGCNCDRWGHPCPGCVESTHDPKAKLPTTTSTERTK
jgi:hypothetical protein